MSRWLGSFTKARVITGVMSSVACLPLYAKQSAPRAAQTEVEEVLVTGSYRVVARWMPRHRCSR